ncbi:hypothetical protein METBISCDRAFT_23195 [Metschnikowia bicuspidata]|uniref:Uncharacterized protein n=1 Tax=Metschnikowia bicuspidata TaxID=27322 RepID=A0A4P9ZEF1_9ASCO|nr:hypothetical protein METBISCDRAFT_23195 [Metschnikowia bicuspidata]
MKLGLLTCISLFSSTVLAKDVPQLDIQFFSVVLQDFQSLGLDYIGYIGTASNVPPEMTSLVLNGATYTDNSFTDFLTRDDVDVNNLRSVATQFPWYSRIESRVAAATVTTTQTVASSSGTTGSTSSAMSSSTGSTSSAMASSTGSTSSARASSTGTMSAGGVANYASQALFGIAALLLL